MCALCGIKACDRADLCKGKYLTPKHTHQWVYVGEVWEDTDEALTDNIMKQELFGYRFVCPDCEEVKVVGEK